MRRLLAIVALALGVGAVLAGGAAAQGFSTERIASFDIDVTVKADGSAEFVERIEYDFGSAARHGIQRDLRTKVRFDATHDRVYPLTVSDVSSATAPAQYEVIDGERAGEQRIRIGDPDRTITGTHTYEIRYRLGGVLNAQDPEPDEFYWNVTGGGWDVAIERVRVTVHVPTSVRGVACFAGPAGSSASCDGADDGGSSAVAVFTQDQLAPGEQLTAVVGIEDVDGAASEPQPILDDRFDLATAFEATPVTVGGAALLAAVGAWLIARTQFHVGRDRRAVGSPTDVAFAEAGAPDEPVPLRSGEHSPVEFVPPDGIRPGQLGVLKDEVAHTVDVSATIIDLAVRGYVRIEEIADDDGDVDDYRLVRLPKNGGLLSYEGYLLTELFDAGPEVELSSLKNSFAKSLAEVKDQLYGDVVARGWFARRPDHVRTRWFLAGLGVTLLGAAVTVLLAVFTHLALLGVPLVVAGVALAIGAKWMPRRTALGHGLYRRVLGFEDFIENSEKHRAQWAERRHLFPEYLPYAIAFGATKKWAKTLESLGAPPPQEGGWYVGHAAYGWGAFGDRMTSFSSSTSSTLASTPGGSGGSGFSGGFSGGGGGGGGGGSW